MRTVAVIQARMGSTRLPGKVLKELRGRSVLAHVVERVGRARGVTDVVIATTTLPEDGKVEAAGRRLGVHVVRGPVDDVLSRYILAVRQTNADHVVRITADCPCTDPSVVDRAVTDHLALGADYTSNTQPRSFPHGLDVEVVSRAALEVADREARQPVEREHVLPFVWSRPERFRIHNFAAAPEETLPSLRVTLDTTEDFVMLRALVDLLRDDFDAEDVVAAAHRHPWLSEINGNVRQKLTLLGLNPAERARRELAEAARWAASQELFHAAHFLVETIESSSFGSIPGPLDAERIKARCEQL